MFNSYGGLHLDHIFLSHASVFMYLCSGVLLSVAYYVMHLCYLLLY
jgi:hypothetical protein